MPSMDDVQRLRTKIKEDSEFFNRLVELIPAKFFFGPEETDQGWKFKKKSEKDALKAAAKENSKKAKKLRFDPDHYRSTLEVQAERAEEKRPESHQSAGETGHRQADAKEGASGPDEQANAPTAVGSSLCSADLNKASVSHGELRERLHRRLADFRAKRRADESVMTAKKAKEWRSKRKRESQQLGARGKGDNGGSPHPSKRQKSDTTQGSDQPKIPEQLEFGRVKISDRVLDAGRPKKKKESKEDLLSKAVALKEAVEKSAPTEAESLRAKHEWAAALERATGAKVLDDPKLLKKSLKREEKLKERSAKQWLERKGKERDRFEAKQRKRKENIQARVDAKKAKKIEKREKKLLRPGFEGRKEGFINGQ